MYSPFRVFLAETYEEGQYPDTPDQHRADNDDFPDRGEVRGIIDAQAYGTQGGNNLEQ